MVYRVARLLLHRRHTCLLQSLVWSIRGLSFEENVIEAFVESLQFHLLRTLKKDLLLPEEQSKSRAFIVCIGRGSVSNAQPSRGISKT